jgi:hypothetical protein
MVVVAKGTVTWEARDGRALWDGRALDEWAHDLVGELVVLFDPVEVWSGCSDRSLAAMTTAIATSTCSSSSIVTTRAERSV